jgi:hypothetical protein
VKRVVTVLWATALVAAVSACGNSVEIVKPTPSSAFRSTYPCELLTKAMAEDLLGIQGLRRIGAQSFPDGVQQCIWARERYKPIPEVALAISPSTHVYGTKSVADVQRDYERNHLPGYRALRGLGDRAALITSGRSSSDVLVEQDGRSFDLILRLKQKPRSEPPPLQALEALARDISARYVHPPG